MTQLNLFEIRQQELPDSKRHLRAWLGLLGCFTSLERGIRRRLIDGFDTTLPRFDILTALASFPDGLTMSRLARLLMVSNGNVTGVVRRLKHDRLVKTKPLETDKRTQFVTLTPKGQTEWLKMSRAYEEIIDEILGELSANDLDSLIARLAKVQKCIDESATLQQM